MTERYRYLKNVYSGEEVSVDDDPNGRWCDALDKHLQYKQGEYLAAERPGTHYSCVEMHKSTPWLMEREGAAKFVVFRISEVNEWRGSIQLGPCTMLTIEQATELRDQLNKILADAQKETVDASVRGEPYDTRWNVG